MCDVVWVRIEYECEQDADGGVSGVGSEWGVLDGVVREPGESIGPFEEERVRVGDLGA